MRRFIAFRQTNAVAPWATAFYSFRAHSYLGNGVDVPFQLSGWSTRISMTACAGRCTSFPLVAIT